MEQKNSHQKRELPVKKILATFQTKKNVRLSPNGPLGANGATAVETVDPMPNRLAADVNNSTTSLSVTQTQPSALPRDETSVLILKLRAATSTMMEPPTLESNSLVLPVLVLLIKMTGPTSAQ
jgi:hypothetical protein